MNLTKKQENLMRLASEGKRIIVKQGGFLYAGVDYLGNGCVSAPLVETGLVEVRYQGFLGRTLTLTAQGAIRMGVTFPVTPKTN